MSTENKIACRACNCGFIAPGEADGAPLIINDDGLPLFQQQVLRKPERDKGDDRCGERCIKDDGKSPFYIQIGRIEYDCKPDRPANQETGSE